MNKYKLKSIDIEKLKEDHEQIGEERGLELGKKLGEESKEKEIRRMIQAAFKNQGKFS